MNGIWVRFSALLNAAKHFSAYSKGVSDINIRLLFNSLRKTIL